MLTKIYNAMKETLMTEEMILESTDKQVVARVLTFLSDNGYTSGSYNAPLLAKPTQCIETQDGMYRLLTQILGMSSIHVIDGYMYFNFTAASTISSGAYVLPSNSLRIPLLKGKDGKTRVRRTVYYYFDKVLGL